MDDDAPRAIRWLGVENCPQVFAFLGLDHGADETNHTTIYGLGPDGDMEAHWGDWLVRDSDGVVSPMRDSTYQATGGVQ